MTAQAQIKLRRMRCSIRVFATVLGSALTFPFSSHAQPGAPPTPVYSSEPGFSGGSAFVDQDLFADWLDNQDRNYTMGLGLAAGGRFVTHLPTARLHFGLDRLLGLSPPANEGLTYHSFMLGGSGFTPDSLLATEPVIGDRPYASLVIATTRRLSIRGATQERAVTTELTFGALGLPFGREIQTWIHERNGSDLPLGWRHQISEGGEATAMYRVAVAQRLTGFVREDERRNFDLSGGGEISAGYYTNASLGVAGRLGSFRSEFWEFDSAPLGAVAQRGGMERSCGIDFFLFGGVRGRAVAYNALLQGQLRNSDYTLGWDDMNHLIGELQGGAHVTLPIGGWSLNATYLVSRRTSEIKGPYSRAHTWGSANIALTRPLRGPGSPAH